MLSGETAYGKYPVEAVRTMAKIAKEAEKTKMPENDIPVPNEHNDTTSFLENAAVEACTKIGIKAIINDSVGGRTSRCLSAYRGTKPVFAFCYYERTMRELALSYGIFPEYRTRSTNTQEYFHEGLQELVKSRILTTNDFVCTLSGLFDSGLGTTLLDINRVDRILAENNCTE
jgi:pyruvate kinase